MFDCVDFHFQKKYLAHVESITRVRTSYILRNNPSVLKSDSELSLDWITNIRSRFPQICSPFRQISGKFGLADYDWILVLKFGMATKYLANIPFNYFPIIFDTSPSNFALIFTALLSKKKCFFLCLLTLTMFLCSKYIYNHRISIEWTWLSKKMRWLLWEAKLGSVKFRQSW